jgi:protein-tyrosine phosphatase
MIDIHCHLLPGVDDGSNSLQQSLEQLRIMSQAGVKKVYITPHFMRNLYHNSNEVIQPVFEELQKEVKHNTIALELELGSELFLDSHSAETVKEENLTLGNSNYVLFETMLQQIPSDVFRQTYNLQKAGYKLIMAHPERYQDIIKKPDLVEDFLAHDIYLQLNAGSFLGRYGTMVEKTAHGLLQKGQAHFIASDNHGDQTVSIQKAAYDLVADIFADKIARQLFVENPLRMENNEKIELMNHWRLPAPAESVWHKLKAFFTGYE